MTISPEQSPATNPEAGKSKIGEEALFMSSITAENTND